LLGVADKTGTGRSGEGKLLLVMGAPAGPSLMGENGVGLPADAVVTLALEAAY
jgi:hypothetical protein